MTSVPEQDPGAAARRQVLVDQFVERALAEVEQMRRRVPQLTKGDPAVWQETRFCAQSMASGARQLELGVLAACALELARITDEKFAGVPLDAHFLLSATTAIETVALELGQLSAARAGRPR